MLEIIKYITSDFIVFAMIFLIISIIGSVIVEIFKAIFKKADVKIYFSDKNDNKDKK